MIRRISICICLLCCAAALPAAAQSLGAFKRQLAEPAASSSLFGRARVIASEGSDCVAGIDVGDSQRAALHYFIDLKVQPQAGEAPPPLRAGAGLRQCGTPTT